MSHYCHACGSYALLDAVSYLCGDCTGQWHRERQGSGERPHVGPRQRGSR